MKDTEWLIVTKIEAEPSMTKRQILAQIERDLNRGDGLWMSTNLRTVTLVKRKGGRK